MEITKEYIRSLSYTDFISFIKETNRCPGGKNSIREIAQNAFLTQDSKILDVGSNTGFNSLEFAHVTKSKVYGIDISQSCVREATDLLSVDTKEIKKRVRFQVGSAYDIPFKNETFDLVMCGGATSFMDDKNNAVSEYFRVLKTWGFVATTQLFYHTKPPQKVLDKISKIIGVQINYMNRDDWLDVLNAHNEHELYYFKEYEFEKRSKKDIDEYVSLFMEKPHISSLNNDVKEEISRKWSDYMEAFSENNDYLSYFIALIRKNAYPEEKEFFLKKNI